MKKVFTLNMGLVEIDYVASNELVKGIKPILVVNKDMSLNQASDEQLHHASILLAVPKEVREAATDEQPLIYIYNRKGFNHGSNDEIRCLCNT